MFSPEVRPHMFSPVTGNPSETVLTDLLHHSVFVNGRSRPVIMEDMQKRIDRADPKLERKEAIDVSFCDQLAMSLR